MPEEARTGQFLSRGVGPEMADELLEVKQQRQLIERRLGRGDADTGATAAEL